MTPAASRTRLTLLAWIRSRGPLVPMGVLDPMKLLHPVGLLDPMKSLHPVELLDPVELLV